MKTNTIIIKPIGVIHTPHKQTSNMPIQPRAAKGIRGYVELFPEYAAGLKDLQFFSHITLLYHFHKITGYSLQVVPFMDTLEHGIFATRSPKRPNAIGISTVEILSVEDNIIHVEQVDMLDGTPLIDIKPFFPKFDNRDNVKAGWLEAHLEKPVSEMYSDKRFSD